MKDRLIRQITNAERELLALKTAQKIPSLIRGYSYSFTVESDGTGDQYLNGMYRYNITYGDGSQPVLSEFYYEGLSWPQAPSGNTQLVTFYSQTIATCTIISTRPIISAVKVV